MPVFGCIWLWCWKPLWKPPWMSHSITLSMFLSSELKILRLVVFGKKINVNCKFLTPFKWQDCQECISLKRIFSSLVFHKGTMALLGQKWMNWIIKMAPFKWQHHFENTNSLNSGGTKLMCVPEKRIRGLSFLNHDATCQNIMAAYFDPIFIFV